jgi:hypothetical protein
MIRCCLCRRLEENIRGPGGLEPTDLPGSGFRCADHEDCKRNVRDIVSAHVAFGQIVG